ncbi:MAG: [FeFe] hydrogenase, group A [Traorella sp.]
MEHLSVDVRVPVELDNPAIKRIESLCIQCGKCRDVCKEMISVLNAYDLTKTSKAICIHCGQCVNVCPTHALVEKKEIVDVMKAIEDKKKKVVFMTSPSVRVGLGEEFGLESGSFVEKKMVGALKALGADYVFDTTFAADLTIMEEASELIDRIVNHKPLPQFTSCCPAWVRFAETYYPELLPHISTSKSPISMFGPTIKTYFAQANQFDSKDIVTVALTPCTSKKAEIRRKEMCAASDYFGNEKAQDVDYVITTRELAQWLKLNNLDLDHIEDADYDSFMPRGSGAGVIFGNSGGVMEAALRTAYYMLTQQLPEKDFLCFEPVRGIDTIKKAKVKINGLEISVAVIHTLSALRQFVDTENLADYHFIEVMCCKGGCIGGGGQPIPTNGLTDDVRMKRIDSLYHADEKDVVRYSHENEAVQKAYGEFFEKPLSELAEKLLHTSYVDRSHDLNEDPASYRSCYKNETPKEKSIVYKCSICGYIYDGDDFENEDDSYVCPICGVPKSLFEKCEA